MLVQTPIKQDIDYFSHIERPGVQIAKDIFSMLTENFSSIDKDHKGCISASEISEFDGNQRLKKFLNNNAGSLSGLAFTARGLKDILSDSICKQAKTNCISFADLNTFSWLSNEINRRNFYDGNFQSLREGAGLSSALLTFVLGIFAGWASIVLLFSKLHLQLSPTEAIALGVLSTVGIPLCAAMTGYFVGTKSADSYFAKRIKRIDAILKDLENAE